MKNPDLQQRFDELDAGRVIGDLAPEEVEELAKLVAEEGFETDDQLEWLAASLDESFVDDDQELSAALMDQLISDAEKNFPPVTAPETRPIPFLKNPVIGWAVAACVAIGFIVTNRNTGKPVPVEVARQALIENNEVIQLNFEGVKNFESLSGDVVWAENEQQGYMTFSGVPANDPGKSQYQLWIVDPTRDTAPVDGGVFDIPLSGGTVVVPIRAALPVTEPQAFVVTLEKPGGVVVSKQETVVAVATRT